jgi:hypothetical protein
MSQDDTLMHKLEALMNKTRGGAAHEDHQFDDIPVLTDILDDGAVKPIYASPTLPMIDEPALAAAPPANKMSDERIRAIAREIQQHVMNNLDPQLTGPIQEKLLTKIDTFVSEAVRTALAELKQEIADSITSAVTDALTAEAASSATPPSKRSQ